MNSLQLPILGDFPGAGPAAVLGVWADSVPLLGNPVVMAVADLALFVVIYLAFEVAYNLAVQGLSHLSQKTKSTLDDELLSALKTPSRYILIVLSAYVSVALLVGGVTLFIYSVGVVDGQSVVKYFTLYDLLAMLLILSLTHAVASVASTIIIWYGREVVPRTAGTMGDEMFPIVRNVSTIAIYSAGLLIVLGMLGIEIAPLLAGLGIAGLAVALALQESLSNFFAGMYLLADKPVRAGDYILVKGEDAEGTVVEIGWRSTKIKQLAGNYLMIPNSKLASSVLVNYHAPGRRTAVPVKVGVAYDSDMGSVLKLLSEVAAKVAGENDLLVKEFEPIVLFTGFKDSYLECTLVVQVSDYRKKDLAISALNLAILDAFRKNNIEIPYPIRTIYMKKD